MSENILQELETAGQILLAQPNLVTVEQRHLAENIFLNFRKTKNPYDLCRTILETSSNDYVLYESVGLLKTAIIREWISLTSSQINSLKDYLFHYALNKPRLAIFIREQVVLTIAIIIKRRSIEDLTTDEVGDVFKQLETLITNGDTHKQLFGCSLISVLVQEYSLTDKSSDINLNQGAHYRARALFQHKHKKWVLKFVINCLFQFINDDSPIPEENLLFVKQLLSIAEKIHYCRNYLALKNDSQLILDADWKDVALDPVLLRVLFTIYWKTRSKPQMGHLARNCLAEMANLTGKVFQHKDDKLLYAKNYMENLLNLLSNINVVDEEAYGISDIIYKFINYYSKFFSELPQAMVIVFIEHLVKLINNFGEASVHEESICSRDCLYMEAFERLLAAWILLLGYSINADDLMKLKSSEIFSHYVKCHLAPPHGLRVVSNNEINEEIDEISESDKDRFEYQLSMIGKIGRQNLPMPIKILTHFLMDRINKLRNSFNQLINNSNNNFIDLQNLYEDLHWLILITGHMLFELMPGEKIFINESISYYSILQCTENQVDINKTLNVLISNDNVSLNDLEDKSVDHIIRLISTVFRLSEIEKLAFESANMVSIFSPELSNTMIWFFINLSDTYILFDADRYTVRGRYSDISVTFLEIFGSKNTNCAVDWIYNFLLDKILYIMNYFKSELTVIESNIELLLALVSNEPRANKLIKYNHLNNLINLSVNSNLISSVAKRGLIRAITEIGNVFLDDKDDTLLTNYWSQTILIIHNKFKEIITKENFIRCYHDENIKIQIIDILDCLIGINQGASWKTAKSIFSYISPIIDQLVNLLQLYHNYREIITLILEVFYEFSESLFQLLEDDETHNIIFVQYYINIIEKYSQHCYNYKQTIDKVNEDNIIQDILLITKILHNVIVFTKINGESKLTVEYNGKLLEISIDSIVKCFNILVSIVISDPKLLQYPTLSRRYYEVIAALCAKNSTKICALPYEYLQNIMTSIQIGFDMSDEIFDECCCIISYLSTHIYDQINDAGQKNLLLLPILNQWMNLILTRQISTDSISKMDGPMYYLICSYKEEFHQLIHDFISKQSDPLIAKQLQSAFTDLSKITQPNSTISHKKNFYNDFSSFVTSVQNIMIVK